MTASPPGPAPVEPGAASSPGPVTSATGPPLRLPTSPIDPGSPPPTLPLPRWFAVLATVCAVGLIPWIVYLAFELPHQTRTAHYDVAWVGFDTAMFLALALLAVAAIRRSTWTEPMAVCTATLLATDAWFDVVTAHGERRILMALISAVLLELPLALLCFWIAHNTELLRRRAYRALWSRLSQAQQRARRTERP